MMKIISYNTMGFEKKDPVLKSLRMLWKSASDGLVILGLQEVRNVSSKGNDVISVITEMFPENCVSFHTYPEPSLHKSGLATVSSVEPVKSVKIYLPRLQGFLWKSLFKLVKSSVPQHGALLNKYLLPDGEELTVVNTHLDVFGGRRLKLKQALAIKESLSEHGSERVIILGDFNASVSLVKEILVTIDPNLQLVGNPKNYTVGIENTISSVIPGNKVIHKLLRFFGLDRIIKFRTDWILARGLSLRSEEVLYKHGGSDHYPIRAEFE